MGPRPKARKNATASPLRCRRLRCFNGAAPEGAEERELFGRGAARDLRLQWGRARRRGRTYSVFAESISIADASMGPRPKARKNVIHPLFLLHFTAASMGPRPKARKNLSSVATVTGSDGLQWGRARRRGRTQPTSSTPTTFSTLQWGRARRRGRTILTRCPTSPRPSLQWGRARRRGRTRTYSRAQVVDALASMGPRPKARKNDELKAWRM